MLIDRSADLAALRRLFRVFPVAGLSGPRQVGKTTLARQFAGQSSGPHHWFDLERDADHAALADPELTLGRLRGLVVLDEVQRRPEIFRALRVLADRPRRTARFLVLGSATPDWLARGGESLAGRVGWHDVDGLALAEVGIDAMDRRWRRGGYPRAFLARSELDSLAWREDYIRAVVERDIPNLGATIPAVAARRFWTMLGHLHGETWNASALGRAFGMSDHLARRWLDALTDAGLVRQLPAFSGNAGKRLVRSPRIFVADTGLLHHLLGIRDQRELLEHPVVGRSWEGFAIDVAMREWKVARRAASYWRTQAGAEIDLVLDLGSRRLGVEVKRTTAPTVTPSMRHALGDLDLDRIVVIHAGERRFPLADRIEAVPLLEVAGGAGLR
jgi:predicted AAA+ superfamily ATPase